MPYNYTFHCKKCGHYKELPTKEDWKLEKKDHKRRGCELMTAPHKKVGVLSRPELAMEARKGKEMVDQAVASGSVSLGFEDEDDDSTNERIG